MRSKKDEEKVKTILEQKGFNVERFSKAEKEKGKTPDFKVFDVNGDLIFYCEVKTISKDDFCGGSRNDPVYNRLGNKIHEAVKQFDNVNPNEKYPNGLYFVNHNDEDWCGYIDLLGVITGFAQTESGKRIYMFKNISDGRIKFERAKIHLYAWIDKCGNEYKLFNKSNEVHNNNLCKYYEVDSKKMKRIRI